MRWCQGRSATRAACSGTSVSNERISSVVCGVGQLAFGQFGSSRMLPLIPEVRSAPFLPQHGRSEARDNPLTGRVSVFWTRYGPGKADLKSPPNSLFHSHSIGAAVGRPSRSARRSLELHRKVASAKSSGSADREVTLSRVTDTSTRGPSDVTSNHEPCTEESTAL